MMARSAYTRARTHTRTRTHADLPLGCMLTHPPPALKLFSWRSSELKVSEKRSVPPSPPLTHVYTHTHTHTHTHRHMVFHAHADTYSFTHKKMCTGTQSDRKSTRLNSSHTSISYAIL